MKKYTLKELEAWDNEGELLGKHLRGNCRIELMGKGLWYSYVLITNCKYNWVLYSTREQELTIGLVRALNKHIKEVYNELRIKG